MFRHLGKSYPLVNGYEKVTGLAKYVYDVSFPNMLWAAVKRSVKPHARILNIDISKALKLNGVRTILTWRDVPKGLHGRGLLDTPILAQGVVRYVGEPVAAVAADRYETALDALDLIEVEYEELPPLFDVEDSLNDKPSVVIHPNLSNYRRASSKFYKSVGELNRPNVSNYRVINRGDAESVFHQADLVVEETYTTSAVSHCQMEPTAVIAKLNNDGFLEVLTSGQTPFRIRKELSDCLELPENRIRVISPKHVGGGFGNRGAPLYEPICAALALKNRGRPVKLILTRQEEMSSTTCRHSTRIYIKDAVMKDGKIVGRVMKIIYNGGAYSVAGNVAVNNAVYAVSSLYDIPNLRAEIYRVYTNQLQGGAFRGFGTTQIYWAMESQMDEIARRLGVDPVDIRMKNLVVNGTTTAIGERISDDTTDQCLRALKNLIATYEKPSPVSYNCCRVGRGVAAAKHQLTVSLPSLASVRINHDSTVDLYVGTTDIGQGTLTGLAQI
ncbi:MAG: molybdopterin cofactor-binding domain-containing protein, partial [Thermoproteota archaeon]